MAEREGFSLARLGKLFRITKIRLSPAFQAGLRGCCRITDHIGLWRSVSTKNGEKCHTSVTRASFPESASQVLKLWSGLEHDQQFVYRLSATNSTTKQVSETAGTRCEGIFGSSRLRGERSRALARDSSGPGYRWHRPVLSCPYSLWPAACRLDSRPRCQRSRCGRSGSEGTCLCQCPTPSPSCPNFRWPTAFRPGSRPRWKFRSCWKLRYCDCSGSAVPCRWPASHTFAVWSPLPVARRLPSNACVRTRSSDFRAEQGE